jgi:HD superfamily phosphohydrolase
MNKISKQISSNIHGPIIIDREIILELFHSKEFRRLSRIGQLGLTNLIYPSATHSRLDHSLGVYHITKKMILNSGIILSDIDTIALEAAALLHDIGHGPFSHLFEAVSDIPHEEYSVMLIKNDESDINKILKNYNAKLPNIVSSIIMKNHPILAVNQILSSEVDSDRIDYLIRDSFYTGNTFGSNNLD